VLATLVLTGCTNRSPSAEAPPATPLPRPTAGAPTPSLPVARAIAPSPSPADTRSGAPLHTTAFTLLEQDIDRPQTSAEPFTQWLLYNIPSRVTALDAGLPARLVLPNGAQQGQNDQQTVGNFGPCPNHGDPPHHYSFELIAQDAFVTLETGAGIDAVRQALSGHTLSETQLIATVQR
jgi:Raf kinase inhibitor-like YbhB/YbcL family protein